MPPLRRLLVTRAWLFAIAFGLFAYGFHKVGSVTGLYLEFGWFQIAAHFLSAAAMTVLIARTALDMGLTGRAFLAFVLAFATLGAVGWEVFEYLQIIPSLIWWGIGDSLLDLAVDAVGVATVLVLFRTRLRPALDPTMETPPVLNYRSGD